MFILRCNLSGPKIINLLRELCIIYCSKGALLDLVLLVNYFFPKGKIVSFYNINMTNVTRTL